MASKHVKPTTPSAVDAPVDPQAVEASASTTPTRKANQRIRKLRSAIEREVDRQIKKALGAKPRDFTDTDGVRHFTVNGRETNAAIVATDDDVYVRVEAPVMPIPADGALLQPFMREVLEANTVIPGHAKLAIAGRYLVAIATQSARRLPLESVKALLEDPGCVAAVAVHDFASRYSGTTRTRARRR